VVVVGLLVLISGEEDSPAPADKFVDLEEEGHPNTGFGAETSSTPRSAPPPGGAPPGSQPSSRASSATDATDSIEGAGDDFRPRISSDPTHDRSDRSDLSQISTRGRSTSVLAMRPWYIVGRAMSGASTPVSRETTPVGARDSSSAGDAAANYPPRDAADMLSMMARSDSMKTSNTDPSAPSNPTPSAPRLSLDEGSIGIDMKP